MFSQFFFLFLTDFRCFSRSFHSLLLLLTDFLCFSQFFAGFFSQVSTLLKNKKLLTNDIFVTLCLLKFETLSSCHVFTDNVEACLTLSYLHVLEIPFDILLAYLV